MKNLLAIVMFVLGLWAVSQNSIAEDLPSLEFLEYLAENIDEELLDSTVLSTQGNGEQQVEIADDEAVAPEIGEK
ncbi:MAG: hypothetical protein COB62_05840 [Piscirickettsiaceae bacterium]|nr:MAG: hypothetical protein COB62_05840 [Piscirickettsiaceae bacterium]